MSIGQIRYPFNSPARGDTGWVPRGLSIPTGQPRISSTGVSPLSDNKDGGTDSQRPWSIGTGCKGKETPYGLGKLSVTRT